MKVSALHQLFDEIAAIAGERALSGDIVAKRGDKDVTSADLGDAHTAITRFLGSLAHLEEVVVDIGKLQVFGRRFPWKTTHIARSDHIRFVWMLFLHLTYTYEERLKLFVRQAQEIREHVPVEGAVDSKLEFAIVHPIIGAFTRERGQHLHQWPTDRVEVQTVGMLEITASWDEVHSERVRSHYLEARADMLATIRDAHRQLVASYADLVNRHKAFGVALARHFSALVGVATEQGVAVTSKRVALDVSAPSFSTDRIELVRRRRRSSAQPTRDVD